VNGNIRNDWSEWALACPVGAAVLDRTLQVVAINPALAERIGRPAEAAIGRPLTELTPWLGEQLALLLRTALESGRPFVDVELSATAPGPRRVKVTGFPVPEGVGLVISEAPADDSLRDREALFHAIFDHAAVAIMAIDWRGNGIWINAALTEMLGYSTEDLARLGIEGITHPDDYQADLAQFQRLMRGEIDHYRLAKRYLRKDGGVLHGDLVVSVSRDAAGAPQIIIAMIEDVSERKRAEDERERLIGELEQAVRARDVFLAVASHELRTPLTSLQLGVQTLARRLGRTDVTTERQFDTALRQIARLAALVDELLDVSRLAEGRLALRLEPFELSSVLDELVERHRPIAERAGCELVLVAAPSVEVVADRARIEQVFGNLLANALKFGAGKPVEVRVEVDGDLARVTVTDQGIGVAPVDQERIFRPFERAVPETRYGGLGLGLHIARRMIEEHGGTIRVDSQLGAGARFTIELPRRT